MAPYPTVKPGDVLTWIPNPYSHGTLNAFVAQLVDDSGQVSTTTQTIQVLVAPVNNQPVMSGSGVLSGFSKNTGKAIAFTDLFKLDGTGALTVTDYDFTGGSLTSLSQVKFRIEGVPAGQLFVGGNANGTQIIPNSLNAASMPMLVDAGADGITTTLNVYWVPPTQGVGDFTVMIVRAFDGTHYSSTTKEIKVSIAPSNVAPSVGAVSSITTTNGTAENAALPLNYAGLHAQINASDADNDVVRYKIVSIQSGSVSVAGAAPVTTVSVGTEPVLSPGETLVWAPDANDNGAGTPAFTLKATDGLLDSADPVAVFVNVSSVNSAPTMATTNHTFTSVTRNTVKEISYSALALALGINDVEDGTGAPLKFTISSLISGQTVRIGSPGNFAAASVYQPSTNKDVISTQSVYWLPPANQVGVFPAFRVVVVDSGGVSSPQEATINMNIDTGGNNKPVLAAAGDAIDLGTRGRGLPIQVTYDQLKTAANASDPDNDFVSFVITFVESGTTLVKGASTFVPISVTSDTSPLPLPGHVISPNEVVTIYPSAGAPLGNLENLFRFRAWDGQIYSNASSEVAVKAKFTTPNSVPTLSFVRDFTTGIKDVTFVFSYDDLRGDPSIIDGTQRTDAYDAEEVLANKTLTFKIKNINGSSYLCLNTATTCNAGTVAPDRLSAGSMLSSSTTYKWVPPSGAVGRVNAFNVVVYDGTDESVTEIPVYVWLKATNAVPVIVSTLPLAGAVEDVPFAITWDSLRSNYPYSDDQSGPVRYEISSVESGQLRMNGALVTPGVTRVGLTDRLEWTPVLNATGTVNAFSVKPYDDNAAEPDTPTQVKVIVTAVNDLPVVASAPVALTPINRNASQTLTHAVIDGLFAGKITDADVIGGVPPAGAISYRIERVSAGTLYSGTTNAGSVINPTTSTSMYTLVNTIGSQNNPVTSVFWEPPLNAEGTFTIMTVRPFDGTDFANTAWNISVTINASNTAPAWSVSLAPGYLVTMPSAVSENGTLPISYAALAAAAPASDTDGQSIRYKLTAVSSGTVSLAGVSYTSASVLPADAYVSAGEFLLWSPPLNVETSPQNAFVLSVSDGELDSPQTLSVLVNVNPTNSAPSIVGPYTVTGVTRNSWREVNFDDLVTYLSASDVESPAGDLVLQIESLSAGQSLKIGTSGNEAGAGVYSSGNKRVTSGKSIYWMPATNQTGIVDAMRFTVIDSGNVSSPSQALLRMNIDSGSNLAPTISGGSLSLGASYGVGLPFTVNYSTLQSAVSATDPDGPYVTFVLTSIANGSIKKGATTMTAMVGASQGNPISPNMSAQLVPGESVVFFPSSTTTGAPVTLATIRGWDGFTYSTNEVTLQATFVAGVNQIPVLTYVKDFNGGLKNTAYSFSYYSLRGNPALMSQGTQRSDAFDAEENISNMSLKFRVKGVSSGVLERVTPSAFVFTGSGTETLDPGQRFTWTPGSDATGRIAAFTLVAYDGSVESASPVTVHVYVNRDPVFINSVNVISGVSENTAYTITYDKLFSTFPSSDDSTGILGYQISDLTGATGTLQRYVSGVATNVIAPWTMYPGDVLMWTPPANENINTIPLHQVFKLRLVDGDGAMSAAIDVKATVSALNTPPVFNSVTPLSSVPRNVSGGKTITFADIFDAIDFRDYDINLSAKPGINDLHGIKFRIESVNAGVLRAVSNTGTVINPSPGDTSSMKYLVQSGADASSSWTQLNWTPPLAATGTFTIMNVRLYDGTDFSDALVSVNVDVTIGNTAPVASGFNVTPGTSEDGGQLFTWDTLMSSSSASDAENDLVRFKISELLSGTIVHNGTTYLTTGSPIPTPPVIGPGDSFLWRPAADASGSALGAFKMKPTDLLTDGSEVFVNVDVSSNNAAPTMLSSYTDLGATRYPNAAFFEISHDSLLTNLSAQDEEDAGTQLTFKVEELLGGQTLYVQTSGNCATPPAASAYFPATTNLITGQSLCWVPPAGVIGVYDALRLTVIDSNSAVGGIQSIVSVSVSVGNSASPAYYGSFVTPTYNVTKTGGTVTWTYEQLKNLSGAYDTDTSAVSLVITNISTTLLSGSATFKKSGISLAAWTGTLGQPYSTNIPNSTMVVAPGESITYLASSSAGAGGALFRFAAMDSYSVAATDKTINVSLKTGTGHPPTFGYVSPIRIPSKTQGVAVTIPYIEFRTHADAHDLDEPLATPGLKFLISSVDLTTHGDVKISKNGAACSAITAGTTTLDSVDSICFTPNATTAGRASNSILSTQIMTLKVLNYTDNVDPGLPAVNLQLRLP